MSEYLISETTHRVCNILDSISEPAAPFYEGRVASAILRVLRNRSNSPNVQVSLDRYGNIIAQYRHPDARFDASLAAVAHMDHPGFHITAAEKKTARASIQGGLPRDERLIESGVLIFSGNDDQQCNRGIITDFVDDDKTAVIMTLEKPWDAPVQHSWGVPDVTRFSVTDDLIHGRAMDDLVGCAQQLAALEIMVRELIPVEFTAIFTRAEEVGFVGAVGACETGSIPFRSIVLSLEASKNLEGARPGRGIILRTGDRQSVFDIAVTEILEKAAVTAGAKQVLHQKKRMDGGTCEAALYMAYGYETGALAVPLINYHNQGEKSVEAEAIHRDDLAGGVVMLIETALHLAQSPRIPRSLFREHMKARFYKAAPEFLSAGDHWGRNLRNPSKD